ncbi:transcriptional regulator, XRE family [Xylanimonas cellulosilytica DSM 15894]|uniref:Transcriptional regulator, XRE family n=1 Tax=Xylanimonas cellulosilytica (strain DSM 15894 / JCM 12276 / CECT 5975 / KCTC 9989 / LMG 20990 / NBRC 107835 / XIL07) TaxID=446471 RepID=D1BZM1_XYLCX|nr:helix-turn-helix transcriptional regulator [Xylanimonas cellulosilytica]ACZ30175.1 transcriptional regulator, XRE family [Xylanimonas cellulosilytica DSM 15894]
MILGTDTAGLLRRVREGAAMTQRELAQRAGVDQATIAGIETGRRMPSLPTLVRLAEAAGRQLRVEIEPLDADVAELVGDVDQVAQVRDAVGAALAYVFETGPEFDPPPYRVEGPAAVALLGAPMAKPPLHIALADTTHSVEWLTQRRNIRATVRVYRDDPAVDPWQTPLSIPPYSRSMSQEHGDEAYEETRDWLVEATRGRPFWVETTLGRARVRLAAAEEVARAVMVETAAGTFPVAPLESLVGDDATMERYLRVLRSGSQPSVA